MSSILNNLISSYLEGGTGAVMLYYDMTTGFFIDPFSNYIGAIKNVSPSSTVGTHDGVVLEASGNASEMSSKLSLFHSGEFKGVDLSVSNIEFSGFSGYGFMQPDFLDSEFTILFSFEKKNSEDGVLFGNLNKYNFDSGEYSFSYGKGFNIGVNDRNKLFFQGIDSSVGEYVICANELELSTKNICSVNVSPFSVIFSLYNLYGDSFQEQFLRTDCKIENNGWDEPFTIGGSPTYLKSGKTFNGFLDKFMLFSGSFPSSDLKAIASGFISSGEIVSGQSFIDQSITGHQITLIAPSGITGYQLVPTGFDQVITNSELIEFVLVVDQASFPVNDGERFITGYALPNGSGSYLEETSFLYQNNDYNPTGNDAFATLGLIQSGSTRETYTLERTKIVTSASGVTLYKVEPLTGILLGEPTGFSKEFLYNEIFKTGDLATNLVIRNQYIDQYKYNYLHYLDRRFND